MQASICNTSHTIKCSILNLFGFGQYFLDYPGELFCPILAQMVLVVEIRVVKPFVFEEIVVLYSVFIAVLSDNKLHTFMLCRVEGFVIVFVCRNCNEDRGYVALYACFNQCFKIIPVVCFISEWRC